MTLGQLVNLEQEKLVDEHTKLLERDRRVPRHPGRRSPNLRDDPRGLRRARPQARRQAPHRAQRRRNRRGRSRRPHRRRDDGRLDLAQRLHQAHAGRASTAPSAAAAKASKAPKADEDDPVEHLFVTSTHDYLLFFTTKGKVYWQKVYNLPQLSRESKGRAVVNLLNLAEDEKIADCRAVRDFDQPDHYLMMATRKGLVKKTELKAYSRPLKSGIIAIKLKEDDELVDCRDHQAGRRNRPRHRQRHGDPLQRSRRPPDGPQHQRRERHLARQRAITLVGMVVADPEATLLTACLQRLRQTHPLRPQRRCRTKAKLRRRRRAASSPGASATEERRRRRLVLRLPLPHPTPRRQGPPRHQNHRPQRPGHRHRPRRTTTTS